MYDPRLSVMRLKVVCWYDDELGSLVGGKTIGSSGGDDVLAPNEYGLLRVGPAEVMTELRRSDLFDPGGKILNVVDVSYGAEMLAQVVEVRGGQISKIVETDGWEFDCISDGDVWHSLNSRSNSVQTGENDAGEDHLPMIAPMRTCKGRLTSAKREWAGKDEGQMIIQMSQSTGPGLSRLTFASSGA